MKKGIVALLILAAVPFFVHAYTSPGKPTGHVNDFAGILSSSEKTKLETTLSNFETSNGAQIAVVTVPTLGDETVDTYAVKLFQEWGIGQKGKDTGALLLVALQEKQMRIEVGYGLEGELTDAQSALIVRNVLAPAFKDGKYDEGIDAAVTTMIDVLGGNPNAVPATTDQADGASVNWFFIAIFLPIWLASILGRSKSWWAGGVLGAIAGIIIGFIYGFLFVGIISIPILVIIGLVFDFIVSKTYASTVARGLPLPWWIGGGRGGGGFGGGFGGFGGGRSGGGGASGGW